MKNLMNNMRNVWSKVVRSYAACMRIYGEGLLRGGSYGCA